MVEAPDFDRIARPYRWLEYFTLGRSLERAREVFLPRLAGSRQALVLGDGDGRFTQRLLASNPHLHVDAVDTSASMLALLQQRAGSISQSHRLVLHHTSALIHTLTTPPDLVVTHFFLDCLTQEQVDALALSLSAQLPAGGLWLLSDFRIPPGFLRVPAGALVGLLYFAFRLLTGLRTRRLPDHASALRRAGLVRIVEHHSLAGMLTSELWQKPL